jgi:hypothetical protein
MGERKVLKKDNIMNTNYYVTRIQGPQSLRVSSFLSGNLGFRVARYSLIKITFSVNLRHHILLTFLAAPRFEAIVVFLPASVFFVVKAGFLTTTTTGFLTFAEGGLEFCHLTVNIHSRNNHNLSHLFRTTSLGGFSRCELDLA